MYEMVSTKPLGPDPLDQREIYVQWDHDGLAVDVCIKNDFAIIDVLYGQHAEEIGRKFYSDMQQDNGLLELTVYNFKTQAEEDAYFEKLGRQILTSTIAVAPLNATSYWGRLDRPGINRLIRLLRKARDASFGRDE